VTLWDVFFSESLEVRRGLTAEEIRFGRARGEIHDDDLVRPADSGRKWTPIVEVPELQGPPPAAPTPASEPPAESGVEAVGPATEEMLLDLPAPEAVTRDESGAVPDAGGILTESILPGEGDHPGELTRDEEDFLLFDADEDPEEESEGPAVVAEVSPLAPPIGEAPRDADAGQSVPAATVDDDRDYGEFDLELVEDEGASITLDAGKAKRAAVPDEDEEATEFTFSRGRVEHVEELDLAPMVDVALQLVLFFLVTAQIVVFKSLEIPAPTPENAPPTVAAAQPMPPEEVEREFITVDITPEGEVRVNDEPVAPEMGAIAAKLRGKRDETGLRRILISADAKTRLKFGVLAIDAAQEVGLEIGLAKSVPNPGN
jgi:biopolymer transport protein ExbD